jgi:hypothetical protein
MTLPVSSPARADSGDLKCKLTFKISGWSLFYKTATGTGTVRCSNGKSMKVKLSTTGGGLTAGKSTEEGTGTFSAVKNMDDLLGSYVAAQAQAGAQKSVQAQVVTKGEVSLALAGKGSGWSLGVALSEFKIER